MSGPLSRPTGVNPSCSPLCKQQSTVRLCRLVTLAFVLIETHPQTDSVYDTPFLARAYPTIQGKNKKISISITFPPSPAPKNSLFFFVKKKKRKKQQKKVFFPCTLPSWRLGVGLDVGRLSLLRPTVNGARRRHSAGC